VIVVLLVMGAVVATVSAVLVGGLMLPRHHVVERSGVVPEAAHTVWSRLADPSQYAHWRRDVRAVDLLSDEPPRWREFTVDGAFVWECVHADAPATLVLRAIDDDVQRRPERRFTLHGHERGTCVTCTESAVHDNPIPRFVYRYLLRPEPTLEALLADLARTVTSPT